MSKGSVEGGVCCLMAVLIEPWSELGKVAHGGTKMNQIAKRNLQRRKRQANRLSKREYFRKKKEALNLPDAGKDKVA
jgi:uncharacterized protein (DUF2384 family)